MKANKKKIIVLCSMVALLIITGALNIFLNTKLPDKDGTTDVGAGAQETFFSAYRSDREATRSQMFTYLDAIINNENSTVDAVANAQNKKLELCSVMESELVLEGLIKAKGYKDAVVTMSTNNINVVIKNAQVTKEDAGQILNIIVSETTYVPNDVVIIPYSV